MPESSVVTANLEQALERQIVQRTWGRVKRLRVQLREDCVSVRGISPTYYLKQLTLQAVREMLPSASVDLAVDVRTLS